MSETAKPKEQWNRLSGEAFVKALQGETVEDKDGKEVSFLEKREGFEFILVKEVIVEHDVIEFKKGNTYKYSIRIKDGDFQEDFRIYDGGFQEDFRVYGGNFQSGFMIEGGDFQGGFKIFSGNFQKDFWISGGEFQGDFRIEGGNFQGHFGIERGSFQEDFSISGANFRGYFGIEGGDFHWGFRIYSGDFKDDFRISGGYFQKGFWIDGGCFQRDFGISGGDFQKDFSIFGGDFKAVYIENKKGYFNTIILATAIQYVVWIGDTKMNRLTLMRSLHVEGRLYLKGITLNSLVIKDFINESLISADRITARNTVYKKIEEEHKPSSIFLESSDLGNTTFFDTAFKAFKTITIKSCRFTGVKTTGGHFPLALGKKKQVVTGEEKAQNPVTLEETYNQLYLAMKNSGNRTWEMRYYAEYMEWHRKRLKEEGKEPFTRLTLWLNKHTNSYNRNWFRAALLTMLITLGFYTIYYLSILGWKFEWNLSFPNLIYHSGNYMQFMLPTHKFNFIEANPEGDTIFIDAVSRIVIGYMIYQTITAFRRFGRR